MICSGNLSVGKKFIFKKYITKYFELKKEQDNLYLEIPKEKIKYEILKNSQLNSNIQENPKKYIIILVINKDISLELLADNFEEFDKWIESFKSCGLISKKIVKRRSSILESNLDSNFEGNNTFKLETHDFIFWNEENVLEFLELSLFFLEKNEIKEIKEKFIENKIDGEKLEKIDENVLMEMKIPYHLISSLSSSIKNLKIIRSFDFGSYKVAIKLSKQTKGKVNTTPEQMLRISKNLSNPDSLKNSYLSVKDENVLNLLNILKDSIEIEDEQEIEQEFKSKVKVKLILTNIETNDTLRKVLSPFINFLNTKSLEYGLFHTALIVGPFYLEWNDSSLCLPKKIMKSGRSFISIEIGEIEIKTSEMLEIINPLSKIISDYNVNYQYSRQKTNTNTGSCQDFVYSILSELDLKWSPTQGGCIDLFLKNVRSKGQPELLFIPCEKFIKYFNLDFTSKVFHNHQELDLFVIDKMNDLSQFQEELNLLKGFDRGFWLKFLSQNENQDNNPLKNENDLLLCPFKHPYETGSFIKNK